jgi:hypothetical protein
LVVTYVPGTSGVAFDDAMIRPEDRYSLANSVAREGEPNCMDGLADKAF